MKGLALLQSLQSTNNADIEKKILTVLAKQDYERHSTANSHEWYPSSGPCAADKHVILTPGSRDQRLNDDVIDGMARLTRGLVGTVTCTTVRIPGAASKGSCPQHLAHVSL